MPNAQALREIIPVIRELDQADRFYMSEWARGHVNPNAADWTQCGTQFCLAGAKAAYDGWKPQYEIKTIRDRKTHQWVQRAFATGRFVQAEDQATVHDRYDERAADPEDIAREAFHLSHHEVQFLFYATHISRVEDMVRRIEWLINGKDPSDFPPQWEDEERAHADEDGYSDDEDDEDEAEDEADDEDDEDDDGYDD